MRIPAWAMALAVLASPLLLVCLAALAMLAVNLPADRALWLAAMDEYLRIGGFACMVALLLAAVTGLAPALLWLRDPQVPTVRWAFVGLLAGVASGVLLAVYLLVGLPLLLSPDEMRTAISTLFGIAIGFGFVSALLARLLLRRYRR